ncbi:tryptophan synthase subunit alpha [Anaerosporobacter sp.]|uniref:tryptophan synthase subunit alpha n=1 Tax=Anaerosporobacter sp. TaxID=1872529 RepID=UPI00286F2A08|nr:tryptophan synthase subunit alpha [Anaerosporobacter sp.]
MSRIKSAFENKKAFIGFLTAGDPSLDKTEEFILEMERAGASLVEIGIPFSDPIAEGPVIQEANIRALSAGCTTDKVFDMVVSLRKKTNIPLVFLTYLNPIYKYGSERFCKRCKEVGIDGLVIPDMPFEEKGELADIAAQYDLELVSLIAPTSASRIEMIAKEAQGFIYVVSSMGVTGVRSDIKTNVPEIVGSIRKVTDTPVAIGFGIHTKEQVQEYFKEADGAIVGSAIVKIIAQYGEDAAEKIYEYVSELLSN